MMNCTEVKEYLMEHGPARLPGDLAGHAAVCPGCARLLEGYRALEGAIADEKAVLPVDFAATRILQRMENRAAGRNRVAAAVLRPALITLALAVALMAGFLIGSAGYSRIAATTPVSAASVETLRSDLFINDFVDEDITLVVNQ